MRTTLFVLLIMMIPIVTGCGGTPPAVIALQAQQGAMIDSNCETVKLIIADLCNQLEAATDAQIEMILDYEIELQKSGDTIAIAQLTELLGQYRAKRAELKIKMVEIRQALTKLDTSAAQLHEIHAAISGYLSRETLELKDLKAAMDKIKGGF